MKTLIWLILLILFLAFLMDFTIQFKPFLIKILGWKFGIAFIFLAIGFGIIRQDIERKAYQKGVKDVIERIQHKIEEGTK